MNQFVKCYVGNLDGSRAGLVVAENKRVAAKVAETSLNDFRNYWNAASPWPISTPKLHTLYTKPYDGKGEWIEGRCKLPSST